MASNGPDKSPAISPAPSGDAPRGTATVGAPPLKAPLVLTSAAQLPPDPFLVSKDDVATSSGAAGPPIDAAAHGEDGGKLPHLPWRQNPLFTKARGRASWSVVRMGIKAMRVRP